jgi:hypothetical protein
MNRDHSCLNTRHRAGILSTLIFSACALLLPGRCVADEVSVAITDPSQIATPGEKVVFTGTVSNFLEESLSSAGFSFTFSGYSSDLTVTQILGPTAFLIGAGDTSPLVDLFSVTLDSTIGAGSYPVDFSYLATGTSGEIRGGNGEVMVTVTPEPSTMLMFGTGLLGLVPFIRRPSRSRRVRGGGHRENET